MATRSFNYFSKSPALPVAPVEYARQYHDQFANALRGYFDQVDNFINGPRSYGVFCSTSTQTNPVANTAMPVTYNTLEEAQGVTVATTTSDSKIYVAQSGVYNFQFVVQLDKTGGAANPAYFWFRVNGTNVDNSASKIVIDSSSAELVFARNYITSLQKNDYFQLVWSSPDTAVELAFVAAASPISAIPSAIATVTWVSPLAV